MCLSTRVQGRKEEEQHQQQLLLLLLLFLLLLLLLLSFKEPSGVRESPSRGFAVLGGRSRGRAHHLDLVRDC